VISFQSAASQPITRSFLASRAPDIEGHYIASDAAMRL
jgi:hypothetical protein